MNVWGCETPQTRCTTKICNLQTKKPANETSHEPTDTLFWSMFHMSFAHFTQLEQILGFNKNPKVGLYSRFPSCSVRCHWLSNSSRCYIDPPYRGTFKLNTKMHFMFTSHENNWGIPSVAIMSGNKYFLQMHLNPFSHLFFHLSDCLVHFETVCLNSHSHIVSLINY